MDRLELIRNIVDKEIAKLNNENLRKFAYIHTYGVAQAACLLAILRNVDVEIACIAAMLHDISQYMENCPQKTHAQRSGELSEKILKETNAFSEEEIRNIVYAISVHSDKMTKDQLFLAELLKDADVMQHYLYNINIDTPANDRHRLFYLLEEFKKDYRK